MPDHGFNKLIEQLLEETASKTTPKPMADQKYLSLDAILQTLMTQVSTVSTSTWKYDKINSTFKAKSQVQGFFSRLAAARQRKQEPEEVDLSPRELLLEEEEADRQQLVEDVVNELRPQNPLT
ncbi:hypothetical protein ACROYT_G015255 [Oculina patagonica]